MSDVNNSLDSSEPSSVAHMREHRPLGNLDADLAQVAHGSVLRDAQNALLTSIEARLAKEMIGLVASITQFVGRSELICEEIPDSAQFCKLISGSIRLTCLQFAVALGKGLDKPIFFDDGRQYLADLNLSLNELFREVDLDGRRFMAIALVDKQISKLDRAADAAKQ